MLSSMKSLESADKQWNSDLDTMLVSISLTSVVDCEWSKLKEALKFRIEENVRLWEDSVSPDLIKSAMDSLDSFSRPPFTIQRVCELAVNPKQHHAGLAKYLRALERTLAVTSSLDILPNSMDTD